MGHITSTCDGILLLSSKSGQVFAVNPILKCWLRVPNFPISRQHVLFSRQHTITHVPRTAKFKLFLVPMLLGQFPNFLLMGDRLSCIVDKDLYTTYEIYVLDFDFRKMVSSS
jgi:hypothetical protein